MAAATGVLADGGAAGFSMRAVAARLGVAPNALYNHVRDKAEVIDTMLDDALGEVSVPPLGEPRDALAAIMIGTYDALASRSDLVLLYIERHGARGPNAIALGRQMLEALRRLGADETVARRARHVLIVQAIGFAAYDNGTRDPDTNRRAFIDSLNWTLEGALRH
jgi:TetR/AcrR family transcriptional regulator, tetracycline repressor protein